MTGAIMAFNRGAISLAMATGARMSAPFAVTPWGSIVPSGRRTVLIFPGTHSRNSIQLMRSISRMLGDGCSAAETLTARRQPREKQKRANHECVRAREALGAVFISSDLFTKTGDCHAGNLPQAGFAWEPKERGYFVLFGPTFR